MHLASFWPCLLCGLYLVPVTCLSRFIPGSSLHSFVLSELFHGSPVPGGMLSCCAQAGLAAVSGRVGSWSSSACVPSWGRRVPRILSLISVGLHPTRWRVRSQGGALGRSQAVMGTWLRFFCSCVAQRPAVPRCAASH